MEYTPTISEYYQNQSVNISVETLLKDNNVKQEDPYIIIRPFSLSYMFGSSKNNEYHSVTVPPSSTHILFLPFYFSYPFIFRVQDGAQILTSKGWIDMDQSEWEEILLKYKDKINLVK